MRNNLYFYRTKEEFDAYFEENNNNIVSFKFVETKDLIESSANNIIDITSVIASIDAMPSNIYSVFLNLENLDSNNKIIVSQKWTDKALEFFPTIFDEAIPIFEEVEERKILFSKNNRILYYYSKNQFESFKNFCNEEKIILTNFASLQSVNGYSGRIAIDITSTILSIKASQNLIFLLEQFFSTMRNDTIIVADFEELDIIKDYFKLSFEDYKNVSLLSEHIEPEIRVEEDEIFKKYRIIDLDNNDKSELYRNINNKLIGHLNFKANLIKNLENYLILNKLNKKKVFSTFLLGNPGLGKTEIGRIISNSLNKESKIIKINFGNYTSQDSLNSLIGSPAGYIGCEGGELSKKINKNNVGIIICDEFEKADSEIKNFFLELLEDGRFTDSMGREYDLNGYIILFTSNLKNESDFDKYMSPEFKSRIDLICQLLPLTEEEKKEYINFQIEELKKDMTNANIEFEDFSENISIQYNDTDDLRELKSRVFREVIKYIKK